MGHSHTGGHREYKCGAAASKFFFMTSLLMERHIDEDELRLRWKWDEFCRDCDIPSVARNCLGNAALGLLR